MVSIQINGSNVGLVPDKWEELTADQYLYLVDAIFSVKPIEQIVLQFMERYSGFTRRRLLGMSRWQYFKHYMKCSFKHTLMPQRPEHILSTQIVDDVVPVFSYVYDRAPFTKNPMPRIRVEFTTLYGPADALTNVTGDEFEKTEFFYACYKKSGSSRDLDTLCGILYRKLDKSSDKNSPNFSGDIREPFNENLIEKYEKMGSRLTHVQQKGICLWYESCKMAYMQLYHDAIEETTGADEIDIEGMRKIVRALAGEKRGTVDEVKKKMYVSDIFFELQQLEEERAAIEKRRAK